MTSSENLAKLESIFVECLETVVNNDSLISDDKCEVIMDIHNKADMFTEHLHLLRRQVAQQELLCGSKENRIRAEIEQLKTKIRRKKLLIAKSQAKFEDWNKRLSLVEESAVKSYSNTNPS
ncbi:hypothetical protein ACHWQZ_G005277 [Mnemiopsis leidyi]